MISNYREQDFYGRVIALVNRQIGMGKVGVGTIASLLGMTPFKFRQQLSLYTDEQPKELIRRLRMERAMHLLTLASQPTVKEIAYQCGFNETGNFTRVFKEVVGWTPSEYRKMKRQEIENNY